jgi:ligand-binding sensor domain-containing protein/signal transduction histidine kinase
LNSFRSAGLAVALSLCLGRAWAIDPARALSQYVRDRWGIEQGFPRGPVYAIAQTTDGYLWIGAEAGLVRFDGRSFRLIKDKTGAFTITSVRGLAADSDGSLWIRLADRLVVRYRNGVFESPGRDKQSSAGVYAMAKSPNGEILLAQIADVIRGKAPGVLVPVLAHNGGFQRMAAGDREMRSAVLAVAQTRGGDFWMGTRESGLFRFTGGKMIGVKKGLPDLKVNCLLAGADGGLWVGTDDGVVRWNGESLDTRGIPPSVNHVQVLSMIMDRDANLWLGTDSRGLLRLNSSGPASLHENDGVSHEAVTALFEDREGSLWMGGADGIERLGDSAFVTYSAPEGLPTDGSNPVFVDARGRLWFPPESGGLWWAQEGRRGHIVLDGLEHDLVYSLAGGNSELWIGRQRGGLTRLSTDGNTFEARTWTKSDGLAQDSVYSVYRCHDGAVWAGTLSAGASVLRNERFTSYTQNDGLVSNTVASILEDSGGVMWFATPGGLSALSKGGWTSYGVREGLPSENVNCLLQDSTGVLWAGTASGAAFRDRGSFRVPVRVPAELNSQILGMAEDRYGWLWIATSNRVLRIHRDHLRLGSLADGDIREYGLSDGLRGTEGVKRHQSVFTDNAGRIWFSLNRGISVVDPARLTRNSAPAIAHVVAVSSDGNPVEIGNSIRLPGGARRTTFGFSGLSLSTPDRVRYRYMLAGYDRGWSAPTAATEESYTSLPPDTYRFRVIASNPGGIWSKSEAVLDVRVDPLFWQTWWFELCALLAVSLITAGCYRLRLRYLTERLNLQFEQRLAERIQVARDLHDTLLQTIQGSKLVVDNALSGKADQLQMRHTVEKLSVWLGQAIDEGRLALSSLRSSATQRNDLAEAFRRAGEECRMQRPIEFDLTVDGTSRQMHPIVRDEVYRIGYEAIRNACVHSEGSHLTVDLSYAHNLVLRVRDDGKGLPPDGAPHGLEGHFGLIGMRERAAKLRARLTFSSAGGSGTLVELIVPQRIAFAKSAVDSRRWTEKVTRLFR